MNPSYVAFMGGVGPVEIVIILVAFLLPLALFIYAIMDLIKRPFTDRTTKLIWALVIIFLPLLGSVLYLIVGRKQSEMR